MIKNIIFDFDGVIIDSIPIKTNAYRVLFKDFKNKDVDKLIDYHSKNGGISRYEKIKYFFEKILQKKITYDEIISYANKYSEITKEELSSSKYLIKDSLSFIKKNYRIYRMHVASGADKNDLKYICDKLDLAKYFLSINGSPEIKNLIVKDILLDNSYDIKETILIGDSVNDFDAAKYNGIDFFGYNNQKLKNQHKYIDKFKDFQIY